jgi:hypothetical protein
VIALNASTGAIRWRSPRFFAPNGVDTLIVGTSPTHILVAGNFQTLKD